MRARRAKGDLTDCGSGRDVVCERRLAGCTQLVAQLTAQLAAHRGGQLDGFERHYDRKLNIQREVEWQEGWLWSDITRI